MRVLAQAVHHPRPEHRADLLGAMRGMNSAADGLAGLDAIGAFEDPQTGRVVAISLWRSMADLQAGMQGLGPAVADVPFADWELEPHTMTVLSEVADRAE